MAQWQTWDDQSQDEALKLSYDFKQMGAGGTAPAPQTTTAPTQDSPFAALSQASGSATRPQEPQGTGVSAWGGIDTPRAPAPSTPQPSAQGSSDTLSRYQTQLEQLGQTSDPRQKAVLQDQIGRSLFSELKTAGHDVQWDGDQMVIDGRRYVIGDGSSVAQPDVMPRTEAAPAPQAAGTPPLQQGAMTYGGAGLGQAGGTRFEGFNDERALTGGDAGSAKDGFRRIVGSLGITLPANQPREVYGAIIRDQIMPALLAQGYPVAEGNGVDTIRVFSNERGWEEIDIIGDAGGGDPRFWWGDLAGIGGQASSGGGPSVGGQAAVTPGTAGASGVQTQRGGLPPPPTVEGIGDLQMTGPGYQAPGDITTEGLPGRSYEDILSDMGQYQPNAITPTYQFDGFGDTTAATEGDTEALMRQLLQHPESLDPRTVSMLQAANREEQAAMGDSLDEDLVGMGYDMGIDSSNFLASERMAGKRGRDEAITRGNRDIEIEAAKVNKGDTRAAAQLGAAYGDSVSRRKLAEAQAGEGNKQTASGQQLQADLANQSNLFNSAQLKGNNAVNAARVHLEQAAALNDRWSLRESTKQAAAELGISRDKLIADFAMAKANELTQRYGIDVGQYIDLTQLQTAHGEFKEDLLFRIMALQQEMELSYKQLGEQGRQFDIGAGIDLAGLQQKADQFGVDAYYRAMGL